MSDIPNVSVVMPAYNTGHTIAEAIRSVLEQTEGDFELVICNDASTDHTVEIVRSFADRRIRLIENPENWGEGRTRDQAIFAARGHWLAVLDADDAWAPLRLERLLAAVQGHGDEMVFDDIMTCHDTPHGLMPWRALRGKAAFGTRGSSARPIRFADYLRAERLLIKPLIPRRVVADNGVTHSRRRFGADTEFFVRLAHLGLAMVYLPEPHYLYRVTPGSATAVARGAHLMRECIEECAELGWEDAAVREAFQWKITSLRQNEMLYELAGYGKAKSLGKAIRLIARNPQLLRVLPRRLARHLAYQGDRLWHGGRNR